MLGFVEDTLVFSNWPSLLLNLYKRKFVFCTQMSAENVFVNLKGIWVYFYKMSKRCDKLQIKFSNTNFIHICILIGKFDKQIRYCFIWGEITEEFFSPGSVTLKTDSSLSLHILGIYGMTHRRKPLPAESGPSHVYHSSAWGHRFCQKCTFLLTASCLVQKR